MTYSNVRDANLRAYLASEYEQPFSGWDFSYLKGRRESLRPDKTWDYRAVMRRAMNGATTLLDMDTGGGEFLASLAPLPPDTVAIEAYAPNVSLAKRRLAPLGAQVIGMAANGGLAFADNRFDLITNRHGAYTPHEVRRVLRPGKQFVTQQVGNETNARLHELLEGNGKDDRWNLSLAVRQLEEVGFHIVEQHEEVSLTRYHDVGAVVYYLKAVPWEIPDFSVERYYGQLVEIYHRIQREGYLDIPFHTFLIIAEKT